MEDEFLHIGYSPPLSPEKMRLVRIWQPNGGIALPECLYGSRLIKKEDKYSSPWLEHAKREYWRGNDMYDEWVSPLNKFVVYKFSADARIYVIDPNNASQFWNSYGSNLKLMKEDGYHGINLTPELIDNLDSVNDRNIRKKLEPMGSSQFMVWTWCFDPPKELQAVNIKLA